LKQVDAVIGGELSDQLSYFFGALAAKNFDLSIVIKVKKNFGGAAGVNVTEYAPSLVASKSLHELRCSSWI
jgi:hypothetical protein